MIFIFWRNNFSQSVDRGIYFEWNLLNNDHKKFDVFGGIRCYYYILVIILMENGKGSKLLSRSLHKIYSNYTKYNSLAKLRSDNNKNSSSKQNITLKHSIYKPNAAVEIQNHKRKSKITCKKNNILKTFVFRDSH